MKHGYIVLLQVFLFTSCDSSSSTTIDSFKIQTDGIFSDDEWSKSEIINLTPNNLLYLMQDEEYLFIGIKNNENVGRYVDLYLENSTIGTVNLHASMQLGERQLTGNWNDTTPDWNWGNNNQWTANIVEVVNDDESIPFLESVKPYEGHEFKIAKEKILSGEVKMRLEIKDFTGQATEVVFPSSSERYSTTNWFTIEIN